MRKTIPASAATASERPVSGPAEGSKRRAIPMKSEEARIGMRVVRDDREALDGRGGAPRSHRKRQESCPRGGEETRRRLREDMETEYPAILRKNLINFKDIPCRGIA